MRYEKPKVESRRALKALLLGKISTPADDTN
jgi:hypothetical protein